MWSHFAPPGRAKPPMMEGFYGEAIYLTASDKPGQGGVPPKNTSRLSVRVSPTKTLEVQGYSGFSDWQRATNPKLANGGIENNLKIHGFDSVLVRGAGHGGEDWLVVYQPGIVGKVNVAESDDDHFYGAWQGGSRSQGGHPAGSSTHLDHSDGKGGFTKERADAVHKPYLEGLTKGVPTSDEPTVYMTGGGPASGKTKALLENSGTGIPSKAMAAHVDPDSAKAAIPEYVAGLKVGDKSAASYVHEESSYMSKAGVRYALAAKRNVVYDSVGDSGIEKLSSKVAEMRAAGARRIYADYATVSVAEAIRRSDARAAATGRWVPHAYISMAHHDVTQTWQAAASRGTFDRLRLWDNNGKSPKLIAEAQGGKITIHDRAAWAAFTSIGA